MLSKIHAAITMAVFFLYVGAGLFFDGAFLKADIRSKAALASSGVHFGQRIYGSPQKPAVSISTGCNYANGIGYANLSWEADSEALHFDIYRGGTILASGISLNSYADNGVSNSSEYSYYVVAKGFAQDKTSDSVMITTGVCKAKPTPAIAILSLENKSVSDPNAVYSTNERRPLFSGNTSIPNAIISITLHSEQIIISETTANENGYWSWTSPVDLSYETHTIYITAVDPEDLLRSISTSFDFIIRKEVEDDDEEDESEDEESNQKSSSTVETSNSNSSGSANSQEKNESGAVSEVVAFPKIKVTVENDKAKINAGSVVTVKTDILNYEELDKNKDIEITYVIIDSEGNAVSNISETKKISEADSFTKDIKLPVHLKGGEYKIRVSLNYGNYNISADKTISISEPAIINLGGSFLFTYSELISNLGWIFLLALFVLVAMLGMLLLEYFYYTHALFNITEYNLWKAGFWGNKRK